MGSFPAEASPERLLGYTAPDSSLASPREASLRGKFWLSYSHGDVGPAFRPRESVASRMDKQFAHLHSQSLKNRIWPASGVAAVGYKTHLGYTWGLLRGATGKTPSARAERGRGRGGSRQRKCGNCNSYTPCGQAMDARPMHTPARVGRGYCTVPWCGRGLPLAAPAGRIRLAERAVL
jgi:hypothetical protein